MDANKFKKIKSSLKDEKSLLRFALIIMLLVTVINYTSIQDIKNNERIVIKTLNQSSQFWVSAQDASDNYLLGLARYVVQLKKNNTAANVDNNFARLLELINPKSYETIKQQLKQEATIIKKYNRNAYSFNVSKTQINRKTQTMVITGNSTRWNVMGKKTPKKRQITISYVIDNSMFSITRLQDELL